MPDDTDRSARSDTGRRLGRRLAVRRATLDPGARVRRLLGTPQVGWAVVIWVAFTAVCGLAAMWAREQPLVAVGRVMDRTALVRVGLELSDEEETRRQRDLAREQTPRVYTPVTGAFETLRSSLENLPKTVGTAESLDLVADEIRRQFALTEESLAALRTEQADGEVSRTWLARTDRLIEALRRRPIVDGITWQRETQEGLSKEVELRAADRTLLIPRDDIVNADDPAALRDMVTAAARAAGFTEPVLRCVVERIAGAPVPTYRLDEALTAQMRNQRAESVATVVRRVPVGQVIFQRGDVLTPAQLDLLREEMRVFREQGERWRVWLRRGSVVGAVGAVSLALAGYLALFCPRVKRNPARMAGIAALLAGMLGLGCAATVASPGLMTLTATAPTLLVAAVIVIAYDQRVALALSALHALLACVALDQPIGVYALSITGVGVLVWQLREVRQRNTLIRAGAIGGLVLAAGTVLVALIDRPITGESLRQTLGDAAWSGAGALGVCIVMLAMLPTIERVFDITTGMTLIELRDPRHPLLRQLQQRAPGTYNHSLNVAAIAEAAADSIGADPLLTYVGALYHDVGKMNKPEYFVENLAGGPSRHEKLSPAMSLLVIVGHVKDGLELAREFGLPRPILHFIEAHHGTTLVEYFYDRARRRAEEQAQFDDRPPPEEVEYRYPGPKPRTRECAILMLADAVESATRTLAEPTPGRIEALVYALANKRLLDGQFDDCDLTLRQLSTIVGSISRSVAAIYHGRVAYPSADESAEARA